jgi:NTP pyrophosphatase (non-canonical NTP hydrolase)
MDTLLPSPPSSVVRGAAPRAVLSGSYRRDPDGLRRALAMLQDDDCEILSPASLDFVDEVDGFVLTAEDAGDSPVAIEARHIAAIRSADFVWLHVPNGYVGPSAALEVGIAHSLDIPVYSASQPSDLTVAHFVNVVSSPHEAVLAAKEDGVRLPSSPLRDLQGYYQRVAIERGFDGESAQDTILLFMEELGELARAIRKSVGLARAAATNVDPAGELADVQLYVLHLANVLEVDLARAVRTKEQLNHVRYGSLAA